MNKPSGFCSKHQNGENKECGSCYPITGPVIEEINSEEKMTAKTKSLDESVAEKLGWIFFSHNKTPARWYFNNGQSYKTRPKNTPDFKNDLNAWRKYVYNEMRALLIKKYTFHGKVWIQTVETELSNIIGNAYIAENTATKLCKAFLEMEEGDDRKDE